MVKITRDGHATGLLAPAKTVDTAWKIAFPVREGLVFLAARDIIRCEASGAYSVVHYGTGKKLLLSKNLRELEALLNDTIFFRVHHSAIINLYKVSRYFRGKGGEVEMEDGSLVPVSSQRKKSFLDRYALHQQDW